MTTMQRTSTLTALLILSFALCQQAIAQASAKESRKTLVATKATNSPKVDGKLDDDAWQVATFVDDFLAKDPVEGAPPTERTEVAVVYDEGGIYIGARMHSKNAENLRMHLDRRDNQGPAEQFIVSIDSYCDRRTAYGFGVNTAGVRFDRFNPADDEFWRDYSFNPVWQAETSRDAISWTAEMYIPFSQLRFNNTPTQVWGINFNRWVPERNEDIYWVYVPKNQTGWSSYFGNLTGIENIEPSRRIEISPYVAGNASYIDGDFNGNPFLDGSELNGRAGADLKMGLGPNLTLDATFNPDFGQVELDPAEVNISAFETAFEEKRPFFIEGSSIFESSLFYSRRIGTAPRMGYGEGQTFEGSEFVSHVDQPNASSILGAAKITGRLQKGLSLGFLTAVTEREYARLSVTDTLTGQSRLARGEIEPATGYSMLALRQEFGASNLLLQATAMGRDLSNPRLADVLRKNAYAAQLVSSVKLHNNDYEIFSYAGVSNVRGSASSIDLTQRSSRRYLQRPDADYLTYDPTRTSLTGWKGGTYIARHGGSRWLWDGEIAIESPLLEVNDMGLLNTADDIDGFLRLWFRETEVKGPFRYYDIRLASNANWNFGGDRQWSEARIVTNQTWLNHWQTWMNVARQFSGQDDTRTRGGVSMKNEAGWSFNAGMNSNFANTFRYGLWANYGIDELDGWLYHFGGELATRIGTRWRVSVEPGFTREDQPRWYVATLGGGPAETYGDQYFLSRLARTTVSMAIRGSCFFTPDLSLELYAEPFAVRGDFHGYGRLREARGHDLDPYTDVIDANGDVTLTNPTHGSVTVGNGDFNFRSFRSNMVLRWEFLPGSTAYLVWQRNLSENSQFDRQVRMTSGFDALDADGEDFFALKLAYWIPVN